MTSDEIGTFILGSILGAIVGLILGATVIHADALALGKCIQQCDSELVDVRHSKCYCLEESKK